MSVLKFKDPETGEIKKVGMPQVDTYGKAEIDVMLRELESKVSVTSDVPIRLDVTADGILQITFG